MKHKKFPAPQIAEAVFRGRKTPYNFEVYPLNVEFNEVPAVYIISKRKIDRHGRAHHAIVCLGQTVSLAAELKNHKKGKCVRQLKANAVSVLLSENEKSRLAIETDLKAAHAIPCLHNLESKGAPKRENTWQVKTPKNLAESHAKLEKPKARNLKTEIKTATITKLKTGGKNDVSKLKTYTKSKSIKPKTVVQNHLKPKLTKAETSEKIKAVVQKSKNGSRLKNEAPVKAKANTEIKLKSQKTKTPKLKTLKTPLAKKAKIQSPKGKKAKVPSLKIVKNSGVKIKTNSVRVLKIKNPKSKAETKAKTPNPRKIDAKLKVEKVKSQAKSLQIKAKPIKEKLIKQIKGKTVKPASKNNKSKLAKTTQSKIKTEPSETKNAPKTKNSKLPSSLLPRSGKLKTKTANEKKQHSSRLEVKVKKPKTAVKNTSSKTAVKKINPKTAPRRKRLAF